MRQTPHLFCSIITSMRKNHLNPELFTVYHDEVPAFLWPYIQTAAMRRLSDIDMYCGMIYTNFPLYRTAAPCSRLAHSIGTALITWHFTESREAALAALFHDIATPVFSHSVDFVYADYLQQEYTEKDTKALLHNDQEILALLASDGIAVEQVDDYQLYPIADNPSPQLAADRLEYTFGTLRNILHVPLETLKDLYGSLQVGVNEQGETELVFVDADKARCFGDYALTCSKIYTSQEDRYSMERLACILRRALAEGILAKDDLMRREEDVIAGLKASPLNEEWAAFRHLGKLRSAVVPDETGDWLQVNAKKRWIDPLCPDIRLTEKDPAYKAAVQEYLNQSFSEYISSI